MRQTAVSASGFFGSEGKAVVRVRSMVGARLAGIWETSWRRSLRRMEAEVGIGPAESAASESATVLPPTACFPRQRSLLYPVDEGTLRATRPLLKNCLRQLIHYSGRTRLLTPQDLAFTLHGVGCRADALGTAASLNATPALFRATGLIENRGRSSAAPLSPRTPRGIRRRARPVRDRSAAETPTSRGGAGPSRNLRALSCDRLRCRGRVCPRR